MLQRSLLRQRPGLLEWPLHGLQIPRRRIGQRSIDTPAPFLYAGYGKLQLDTLRRPLSIESVRDGGAYVLDHAPLTQTNLFLRVGSIDDLFFKLPSPRGWADYRSFFRFPQPHPEDIRALESPERFENLPATLVRFPTLDVRQGPETTHYLAVYKLQYERIRNQTAVGIPQARFGALRSARRGFRQRIEPALFQERVSGTTLWDIFDFDSLRIKPAWQPHLPIISAQLSNFLDAGLLEHVDWNIQNFVFHAEQERLFYVDLKPTIFVAKSSNAHNLKGIRDYFLD